VKPGPPDAKTGRRRTVGAAAAIGALVLLNACSGPPPLNLGSSPDTSALREAVSGRNVITHLKALQQIADAHGGNRADSTSGYQAAAVYIEEHLRAAGYTPVRQRFSYEDSSDESSRESFNILADTGGHTDRTIVVGAHLDSVAAGPGINDNGSGVAAILETAVQMAKAGIKPANRVRFAFWGGEEEDLNGSAHYVDELSQAEVAEHAANLNFDMVGSPNAAYFVYDGDGSEFGEAGPEGSAQIEDVFLRYFASEGPAAEPTQFDGGSDYDAFMNEGIPVGGLFTGDVGIKSASEAAVYGGTADKAYDPCYHASCDTIENVDENVIAVMSDAVAHATQTLAQAR
jgi:aminopeptidase S